MAEKNHFNDTTPFFFRACQYVNNLVGREIEPEQRCALWYLAFNAGNDGVAEIRLSKLEGHFGGCPQETARESLEALVNMGLIEIQLTSYDTYRCTFVAAGKKGITTK